ncbi:MAG: hypothetical protein IJB89_03260 [Akkermansia sp.]|nr:hypothetical protein [Akkermansia sp.]
MKDTFAQFIRLGLIILGLAAVLYWADTAWMAPHRLPPCEQGKLPENRVCLETVLSRYGDKIIWIDARSAADFELNQLMLSENRMFPIRRGVDMQQQIDAAIGRLLEAQERGECVVVFCTADCGSAEEIAGELRALGMIEAPIYTLEGGWDTLKAHNLLRG